MNLALAVGLFIATAYSLRGGFRDPRRKFRIAADWVAIGLAVASVVLSVAFFGPMTGIALVLIIAIHEFGHVAAYRICGHDDARFRLIPLMGGVAISNQQPKSPQHAFFIALMGPAICIGPCILAAALVREQVQIPELLRQFLWSFALYGGVINLFNLLPIGPLDGGKLSRVILARIWPKAVRPFSIAMCGIAIILGILIQSIFLVVLTALTLPSILQEDVSYGVVKKLSWAQTSTMLGAYLATAGAFGLLAWPLIVHYLL